MKAHSGDEAAKNPQMGHLALNSKTSIKGGDRSDNGAKASA
jgi:hypothetical protein